MDTAWQKFKNNIPLRRFVVFLIIVAFLYEMRAMMNTILLTFIFTYVIVHLIHFVQRYVSKMPTGAIVVVTYLIILALLYFVITVYMPMLVGQISKMGYNIVEVGKLEDTRTSTTKKKGKYPRKSTISSGEADAFMLALRGVIRHTSDIKLYKAILTKCPRLANDKELG